MCMLLAACSSMEMHERRTAADTMHRGRTGASSSKATQIRQLRAGLISHPASLPNTVDKSEHKHSPVQRNATGPTCRATCTGCTPSTLSSHSFVVWNTSGSEQRYGTPRRVSASTAFGASCRAGPPTSAKPVRLTTTSTKGVSRAMGS